VEWFGCVLAFQIWGEDLENRSCNDAARRGADLINRPKGDADNVDFAARLRKKTKLPLKVIAAKMHLESSKASKRQLHNQERPSSELTMTKCGCSASRRTGADEL